MQEILEQIQNIDSTIFSRSSAQQAFAIKIAAHTHTSAVGPIIPSVELTPAAIKLSKSLLQDGVLDAINERLNSAFREIDFLSSLGNDFINSQHNRTN